MISGRSLGKCRRNGLRSRQSALWRALIVNIGSVPVLLYGADRASSKQASGLTFQSGGRRLGRRYFVTVARPDHKNLAVGAKRLTQRNLQQILRLPPRAV